MNNETKDLALVSPEDLTLVEDNSLNAHQLSHILKKTPVKYVKQRPAKGGGTWDYVTGGYVKKCLNLMFGWDWDFEVLDQWQESDEVVVKGKLTCRSNGKQIIKMQFGNKDIVYKKQSEADKKENKPRQPLSIGNDYKAACTDCLKKCAAEIGIAADIYNKDDFREVLVDTSEIQISDLRELYELKKESCTQAEQGFAERVLNHEEKRSYSKLHNLLKSK